MDREKERIRALSPSRDPAGFVGLDELQTGLLKLRRAARKTWKLEKKYLAKVFNTYSCLEGSVDGIVLKDFVRTNLHVRLSLEEANAIMQHVDRLGYGYIPMDFCLRQLKILALGTILLTHCLLTHSFTHSLTHLLTYSLTHSFIHSLTHSFTHYRQTQYILTDPRRR